MGTKVSEVKVSIGGRDVESALSGCFGNVRVELDMDGESRALIELTNAYDITSHSIDNTISGAAKPGSKVEVEMGYAGDKSKVFAGYLDHVELEADQEQPHLLRLHACDVIKLMKENSYCRILTEKKHSDIFAAVLDTYGWTGIQTSSDDTNAYDEAKSWYQNESDYDFVIRELVERCPGDWEFYVSAGTAYYKKPDSSSTVMEIGADAPVIRIKAVSSFLNQEVTAYGSSSAYVAYTGSSAAKADGIDSSAGSGGRAMMNPDGDSQDMVDGMALACANRLKRRTKQIEITVEGNYSLLSGKYVKVSDLDNIWNGVYRIRKAVHSYGGDGYLTEITLEGS